MTPPRTVTATLGVLLAAAAAGTASAATSSQSVVCVNGSCVTQSGGAVAVSGSSNEVRQSATSTSTGGSSSVVTVSQSGGTGSISAGAAASGTPGPLLVVRLPASRLAALLADRSPLLEVSADRPAAVRTSATLLWRAADGRRARLTLFRRDLRVDGSAPRRLRLGASARALARLPESGRITLAIRGRAPDGATVTLRFTA
jgi:hypothetical protein